MDPGQSADPAPGEEEEDIQINRSRTQLYRGNLNFGGETTQMGGY